jgi:hypothetical protein
LSMMHCVELKQKSPFLASQKSNSMRKSNGLHICQTLNFPKISLKFPFNLATEVQDEDQLPLSLLLHLHGILLPRLRHLVQDLPDQGEKIQNGGSGSYSSCYELQKTPYYPKNTFRNLPMTSAFSLRFYCTPTGGEY